MTNKNILWNRPPPWTLQKTSKLLLKLLHTLKVATNNPIDPLSKAQSSTTYLELLINFAVMKILQA